MRIYIIGAVMVLVALFTSTALVPDTAQTETYRKDYDISVRTYQSVSNDKYGRIVSRVQPNSARVMRDAARDACNAEGGRLQDDFSCK